MDALSHSACICQLKMIDARLDGFGIEFLCKALKNNSTVTLLDISENDIGLRGRSSSDSILLECSFLAVFESES